MRWKRGRSYFWWGKQYFQINWTKCTGKSEVVYVAMFPELHRSMQDDMMQTDWRNYNSKMRKVDLLWKLMRYCYEFLSKYNPFFHLSTRIEHFKLLEPIQCVRNTLLDIAKKAFLFKAQC
jgi:hypothetical protein